MKDEIEPIVRDQEGRVVRISALVDRDPLFLDTVTSPPVLDPLESLLGPDIELLKNRHNHATLRLKTHRDSGLHRDVKQWSRTIFTVIFFLEETNVENGCTRIVPGSHHFPGVTGKLDELDWTRELMDQAVPAPMPAGGMLVIDSMIMHRAGFNHTDGTRMSMTIGYHSVDELSGMQNPKRVLVRGEGTYGGNDTKYV